MCKYLLAIFTSILISGSAFANWTGKDASSATITFYNPGVCSSVVCTPVMQITDGTNVVALTTIGADGVSNTQTGLPTYARMLQYNGTTWDRWQGAIKAASGAFAAGSIASGAGVDGWDLTQGTKADVAWVSGSGSVISILKNIAGGVNGSVPAGTSTIGNVGSDPSSGKGAPSSVAINVSTATTTQLVALSGSTKIYVTSFDVIAGGTGNITFEYGTGVNCATGTTALTGAYNLAAQAGIAKGDGTGAVLIVPAGNALCVLTSAAVQMSGSISYQQF